jgi:hypothetical protein
MISKIKDILSDVFGFALMCGAGYMCLFKGMPFIWNGVVGIVLGAIFFMIPDAGIANALGNVISTAVKKLGGKDEPSDKIS